MYHQPNKLSNYFKLNVGNYNKYNNNFEINVENQINYNSKLQNYKNNYNLEQQ